MRPWQVLSSCPDCLTDGAVEELMDPLHPATHLGVPASARCRMCGRTTAADDGPAPRAPFGEGRCPACATALTDVALTDRRCHACGYAPTVRVTPGVDVRDRDAARAALGRWAAEEGLDVEAFASHHLGGALDEVLDRYQAGEPVETGMDAIAFLFPSMSAGGGVGVAPRDATPAPARVRASIPADPRAPAKLLISVMLADGQLRQGERAFVDRWLAREGMPALTADELHPWRPHEVGPIGDPGLAARSLEAAVELMHLDGQRDGSELRIVRTFARVWGVPSERIDAWDARYGRRYAPRFGIVWSALSRWVRTR